MQVDAAESEKLGGEVIVNVAVVVLISVPDVPVIVSGKLPIVAVLLTVSVKVQLPFPEMTGLLWHDEEVTPEGKPEIDIVTFPLNGLTSVTVTASVALPPCATDKVGDDSCSVKPPALVMVS